MLFQYLIHAAVVSLGPILMHILLTRGVPMAHPRLFIWLSTGLNVGLWTLNAYILPVPSILVDYLIYMELLLAAFLSAKAGFRIRSAIFMTVYIGLQMIAVFLLGLAAFPTAGRLGIPSEALLVPPFSIFMGFLSFVVYAPIVIPAHYLLCRIFEKASVFLWPLLLVPLPVSQTLILHKLILATPSARAGSGLQPVFALGLFLSLITDAAFCVGLIKIRQAKRLEEQVRTAQEQLDIQSSYYMQLRDNILEVNQIRHDLNNQLQAAYVLLEQGEHERVRSQLDQLQSSVQERVGPRFCGNLMIDAVLSHKAKLCQEHLIRLNVNLNLPEELSIDSTHLCSAFSNLLDNSIHGCLESRSEGKTIELQASLNDGYLIIRCTNPAMRPRPGKSGDPLRAHGLGLDILRRIAAEYDGTLDTSYQEGFFETVLILKYEN